MESIITNLNETSVHYLFRYDFAVIPGLHEDGNQGQSRKSERHLARKGINLVRVSDRCDRLRRRRFRISLSLSLFQPTSPSLDHKRSSGPWVQAPGFIIRPGSQLSGSSCEN